MSHIKFLNSFQVQLGQKFNWGDQLNFNAQLQLNWFSLGTSLVKTGWTGFLAGWTVPWSVRCQWSIWLSRTCTNCAVRPRWQSAASVWAWRVRPAFSGVDRLNRPPQTGWTGPARLTSGQMVKLTVLTTQCIRNFIFCQNNFYFCHDSFFFSYRLCTAVRLLFLPGTGWTGPYTGWTDFNPPGPSSILSPPLLSSPHFQALSHFFSHLSLKVSYSPHISNPYLLKSDR